MMRIALAIISLVVTASPALAQFSIGTMYRPLPMATPPGADTCSRTWYDPDIHLLPNGTDLGVLAQASAPTYCTDIAVDTFQRGARNGLNGAWTLPAAVDDYANVCPTMQGRYTRCDFQDWFHAGPIASPSIVRLPNEHSPTGVRYYMAFVGGNSDYIHGKIYWAVSDDGQTWDTYARNATEFIAPIISARYTRSAESPRSAPPCSHPSGIAQVQLGFENDRFYVFFQYWHPIQPECTEGHNSPACVASGYQVYDRALSSVLYRFDYNPKHPFGFGGSVREIYLDGEWQPHSGRLVWGYDDNANGSQLRPDVGNPVLELYNGVQTAGFGFGQGDVKFGNDRWLHVYVFEDLMRAQTATSLDPTIATWSVPETIDVTRIRDAYPLSTNAPAPGIWYGALSGTPEKWWIWAAVPTEDKLCAGATLPINPFGGLALLPAVLCTPDRPCP
jgi:hypothetical protein